MSTKQTHKLERTWEYEVRISKETRDMADDSSVARIRS